MKSHRSLAVAALIVLLALPAHAQFLGFTSPQTVGPVTVLNAVTVATASSPVQNIGQSVHYLTYVTSGTVTQLNIQLEGSIDGVTWLRISETATAASSGALFANVYLPFIRANLTAIAGGGTLTATYTGTSVTAGPPAGLFLTSGIYNKALGVGLPANATRTFDVDLPQGGTGGILYFKFSGAGYAGATLTVDGGPDVSHLANVLAATTLAAVATEQSIRVTAVSANLARVTYTTAGATAITYDLAYGFGGGGAVSADVLSIAAGSNTIGNVVPRWGNSNEQMFNCNAQTGVSLSLAGNTQIISAVGGQVIRVCHLSLAFTANVNLTLRQGTGVNCATGDTAISGTYQSLNTIVLNPDPAGVIRTTTAGQALCVNLATAVTGGGIVTYAQF